MKIITEVAPDFQSNTVVFRIELEPSEAPPVLARLIGVPESVEPPASIPVRYLSESEPSYQDGHRHAFDEGARAAMCRVAEMMHAAHKARSRDWARECAELGMASGWPPAPAYKGDVVHVDDPAPDLGPLTRSRLESLNLAVTNELSNRPDEPREPWLPDYPAENSSLPGFP